MNKHDWDTIMLYVWVVVFVVCTVCMPINVAAYLMSIIDEKTLILITLVLSYVALQLAAATGIITAVANRRLGKQNSEGG